MHTGGAVPMVLKRQHTTFPAPMACRLVALVKGQRSCRARRTWGGIPVLYNTTNRPCLAHVNSVFRVQADFQ